MIRIRIIIEKLSIGIEKITQILLGIIGGFLIILVSFGIVMRYIFKSPLTWSYELSIICFLWVSFLGAAMAVTRNSHISFDFIVDRLPERIRSKILFVKDILALITTITGTVLGGIVCYSMFPQKYQTIPISLGWLYLALPVGFACMALNILKKLVAPTKQDKTA
jgi:TRAP-type C4-dicarboxylate transport system permease small subunit